MRNIIMKYDFNILTKLIIISTITMNIILYGCSSCDRNKTIVNLKKEKLKKTEGSKFIDSVPSNGEIDGFVIASCNKCKLGNITNPECSVGIKIGEQIYNLKNISDRNNNIDSSERICNTLRIAYIYGQLKDNNIYAKKFKLIKSPI